MCSASDFVIQNGMLVEYAGPGGDVVIPENVQHIGWETFSNRTDIQSVTLPEGCEKIMRGAFFGCTGLREIICPSSVRLICGNAFSGCSSLKDIRLPAGIKSIKKDSFEKCKKLVIHAPAGSYAETYALANGIPFVAE